MRKKTPALLLFLAAFLLVVLVGLAHEQPLYMDAQYYFVQASRLAAGDGLTEPYIWNYLNPPDTIPHPAFDYWMPLTSLLAVLGIKVLAFLAPFRAAQVVLGLVYGLVAVFTYQLGRENFDAAWQRVGLGLLILLPAFYLPFIATTDAFTINMLLGAVFFLLLKKDDLPSWKALAVGGVAALFHLTRADGLLWLGVACFTVFFWESGSLVKKIRSSWKPLLLVIAGYMAVMAPWLVRNFLVLETPLPVGGSRALWLTNYDELYTFPGTALNMNHWLESGFINILSGWWQGLKSALISSWVILGAILGLFFILSYFWQERKTRTVRVAVFSWLLLVLVYTFVFPYAGIRGSFFHSAAALQPFLWVAMISGIGLVGEWLSKKMQRPVNEVSIFLLVILLVIQAAMSIFSWQRSYTLGSDDTARYEILGTLPACLQGEGAGKDDTLMVNNPPEYYLYTGYGSVVIPYGGYGAMLGAAEKYQVDYLVLEFAQPGLEPLFELPGDRQGLEYLTNCAGSEIYRFVESE